MKALQRRKLKADAAINNDMQVDQMHEPPAKKIRMTEVQGAATHESIVGLSVEPILKDRIEANGKGGSRPKHEQLAKESNVDDFIAATTPDSGGAASSRQEQPQTRLHVNIDQSDDEFNRSEDERMQDRAFENDEQSFTDTEETTGQSPPSTAKKRRLGVKTASIEVPASPH